jgi:hypothetical protein
MKYRFVLVNLHNRVAVRFMAAILLSAFASSMITASLAGSFDSSSYAQASTTNNNNNNNSNITNAKDTINLKGDISSVVYVAPSPNASSSSPNTTATNNNSNNTENLTGQLDGMNKFILSGNWSLAAQTGNTTNFKASFIKVLDDGNRWHTHDLINFKQANNTKVQLDPENNMAINGKVDVMLNNTTPWKNTDVDITISKGNTIQIKLDNEQTANHFQNQSIYGIVESIADNSTTPTK